MAHIIAGGNSHKDAPAGLFSMRHLLSATARLLGKTPNPVGPFSHTIAMISITLVWRFHSYENIATCPCLKNAISRGAH